ncbi:DUF4394 domain-containing protein [Roseococcus sp. YIM B11640]|uniref:DUF4394 domain-containing protein n=1 Tax=Roseococcus sp. YIM B11640 TaxID=3133973 RepID=UPI003C7A2855
MKHALALMGGIALLATAQAEAATLVGLTGDNQLIRIDSETRRAMPATRITGADGTVVGIDQRPQDGRLYGITSTGQIVTIDPANGRATQVSRLNVPFQAAGHAIFDFNPVANRVRVMGMDGQNLRVNVETGEAATDGRLKNGDGPLASTMPRVVAGAYTNSMQGATATQLLTIDTSQNALNVQNPPNDGVQAPRARLSAQVPASVAFDILSDGTNNWGFVMAGSTLHSLDLTTGALTPRGTVTLPRGANVIDLAAMR